MIDTRWWKNAGGGEESATFVSNEKLDIITFCRYRDFSSNEELKEKRKKKRKKWKKKQKLNRYVVLYVVYINECLEDQEI